MRNAHARENFVSSVVFCQPSASARFAITLNRFEEAKAKCKQKNKPTDKFGFYRPPWTERHNAGFKGFLYEKNENAKEGRYAGDE